MHSWSYDETQANDWMNETNGVSQIWFPVAMHYCCEGGLNTWYCLCDDLTYYPERET